jgi:Cytochrome b(N-terminal)/b6/petB
LGRQPDDRGGGHTYDSGVCLRCLQEAPGSYLDGWRWALADYACIRTHRVSTSLGPYWGTVVTTQIASNAPLLGPYLTRLLGSEGAVGAVTFARFFAMHVLLLPPMTTLLIAIHVYLVRKHGVTPAPEDHGSSNSSPARY